MPAGEIRSHVSKRFFVATQAGLQSHLQYHYIRLVSLHILLCWCVWLGWLRGFFWASDLGCVVWCLQLLYGLLVAMPYRSVVCSSSAGCVLGSKSFVHGSVAALWPARLMAQGMQLEA